MIIITNIFSYNLKNYYQIYIKYHLNKRLSEKLFISMKLGKFFQKQSSIALLSSLLVVFSFVA